MELTSVIGSESVVFSVKAKRKYPVNHSIPVIFLASLWSVIPFIGVVVILVPLFRDGEVHFTSGRRHVTAGWDNLEPLLMPALTFGFFLTIGFLGLGAGLKALFSKGGYFAGTESRLIHHQNGKITSYQWEQFSGVMELDYEKGDLTLQLKTGTWKGEHRDEFVPDRLYLSGIPEVMEIEAICRKLIGENEPVPQSNA